MATNLALDEHLLDEALLIGNLKTKKDTVTAALKEFIAKRKQKKILELLGTIEYDDGYDYKKMRKR
jgi:Arc/MetJ family transcription regulator